MENGTENKIEDGIKEKWYDYWWLCARGISNRKKILLGEQGLTGKDFFYIEEIREKTDVGKWLTEEEWKNLKESRTEKDWKWEYEKQQERGIRIVTRFDSEYPDRLKKLKGMPFGLVMKGKLPKEEALSVAIVGARNCSHYGEIMTLRFAEKLAECGAQIISGMARGIDGAAHRGALNAGGTTFAVLGCGVDICYPREHRGLYKDIQTDGGLISEYPPGTAPFASNFPARNRILSGLADVVLVMEAKEKSGSLITADMALEQGKDVYALPGNADSGLSRGCHYLIRQGAGILIDEDDLLEELHLQFAGKKNARKKEENEYAMLEKREKGLYEQLDYIPKSREELLQKTGFLPQELAGILVSLELKGMIKEVSKDYFVRNK